MPTAQKLPHSDTNHDVVLGYRLRPEQPQVEAPPAQAQIETPLEEPPSLDWRRLAAGHPAHTRFAVSDGRRVWLGEDTTLRELDRPRADASRITNIVMDDEGALWLLTASNELHVVVDDQIELAPPLPVAAATSIHAGAGHLVVFGGLPDGAELPPEASIGGDQYGVLDEHAVMAVGRAGRDWTVRRRPEDTSEFDDLAIAPDGSLMLMDGQEAGCGGGFQARWQGHLSERSWTMLPWPHDAAYSRVAASGGWSYGLDTCDADEHDGVSSLCAVDAAGHGSFALGVGDDVYAIAHTEGVTMVASAAGLWSLHGSEAQRIGEGHEAPFATGEPAMAISHTRAILYDAARVHIGSAQGWTELSLD
jgi:hypothetical protein